MSWRLAEVRRRVETRRTGTGEPSLCSEDRAFLLGVLDDLTEGIEVLVKTAHAGAEHHGTHIACDRAPCAPLMYEVDRARTGI